MSPCLAEPTDGLRSSAGFTTFFIMTAASINIKTIANYDYKPSFYRGARSSGVPKESRPPPPSSPPSTLPLRSQPCYDVDPEAKQLM